MPIGSPAPCGNAGFRLLPQSIYTPHVWSSIARGWLQFSEQMLLGRSWTVPTSIGVPALGGNSLFQLFLASIGDNLAAFPRGPPLEDPFW